ncbi:major capsid protein [Pseudarthrobacter sp. P1]|uniref:major capsid protein n=1 Tax=Pseudarthrobacter sp. P1 TaxID=3418418 RepID=UPI003CF16C1C
MAINVADFLNNPSRVERVIRDLTKDKTIADYGFAQGDAKGGAVVYSELLGLPEDGARDVEVIAPGANFPGVDLPEEEEKADKVAKYGGDTWMTFEARRRNETDTLDKRIKYLTNLIIKRVNKVCVNALVGNANINKVTSSGGWDDPDVDALADIFLGKAKIDDAEMGYSANLVLINPMDAQKYLLGVKSIREQLPRESKDLNPVLSGDLSGLCGVEWIKSAAVAQGKLYVLDRGQAGSVRDEEGGVKTNVYDEPKNQRVYIQGWRSIVPIITDPKAVTEISGFDA